MCIIKKSYLFFVLGKKKLDPSCCPVCGVTVRAQELEQHFVHELDKLFKLTSVTPRPKQSRSALPPGATDHPHSSLLHAPSASDGTPLGRWETFKRVKANRQVSSFAINSKYHPLYLFIFIYSYDYNAIIITKVIQNSLISILSIFNFAFCFLLYTVKRRKLPT